MLRRALPCVDAATAFGVVALEKYRLFCLDKKGAVAMTDWIEAADDGEAIARARALANDALQCELWLRNRLVASMSAKDLVSRED